MTTILLVTLVVCYIAQRIIGAVRPAWVDGLMLSLEGLRSGRVYELITFQFLHGGLWHLLGNMIGLYFFGRAVEAMLGSRGMLALYLVSGTVGGLLQVGLACLPKYPDASVVGASAGVFGLIAAFAINAPDDPITLLLFFILPVTFPAKVLLWAEGGIALFGVLEPFMSGPATGPGIAHAAHLGGMLTGIVWIRWRVSSLSLAFWRPFIRRRSARRDAAGASSKRPARGGRRRPEELPPAEFISREVDPILEKISAHGIHSLTERERQILEAARSKMAKR